MVNSKSKKGPSSLTSSSSSEEEDGVTAVTMVVVEEEENEQEESVARGLEGESRLKAPPPPRQYLSKLKASMLGKAGTTNTNTER